MTSDTGVDAAAAAAPEPQAEVEIRVRYFALLRERLGVETETRRVAAGTTVGQLRRLIEAEHPDLAPLFGTSMLMRNHEYSLPQDEIAAGDEIAFIPPVSGGEVEPSEGASDHVRVTPDVLDTGALAAQVARDEAGAVAVFAGAVRNHARGRQVLWLDYEAYPEAAETQLWHIVREMRAQWPLEAIAIEHRYGKLGIGEISVVIAVSSAHRAAAFAAAQHAIERIKEIVPIWKKEAYADGEMWIGTEAEYQQLVRSGADTPQA